MELCPVPPVGELLRLPGLAGLAAAGPALPPVHLVGGAVRDLLLGRAVHDVDLVIEGELPPVLERLAGTLVTHGRFGTARITTPDGATVDLARARRETYARPGALPDVVPADLDTDLRRRDFTFNAVAIGLTGAGAGRLTAHPGALEDLGRRELRVLHDRSFLDDPTRLFRLARYAARLDAREAAPTAELVREAVSDPDLVWSVGGDRLGAELRLLAAEADPGEAFHEAGARGILHAVDEGLSVPDRTRLDAALEALRRTPEPGDPGAMTLASAIAATRDPAGLAERLGLDAHTRRLAAAAQDLHSIEAALGRAPTPSAQAALLDPLPVELAALLAHLDDGHYLTEIRPRRIEISGDDLLAAGIPRGPELGRGLRRAREALLDGRAPDRASQLAAALNRPDPAA